MASPLLSPGLLKLRCLNPTALSADDALERVPDAPLALRFMARPTEALDGILNEHIVWAMIPSYQLIFITTASIYCRE